MVSIKEVASEIGVPTAMVPNAQTGKGRVFLELIGRIRARADELGY